MTVPVQQAEEPPRADHVVQQLTELPRAQIAGLFDQRCVTINDALCPFPGYRVEPGDRVSVRYDPHQRYHVRPKPRPDPGCPIVFEDQHLLVVMKPAEWLTVPTRRGETNTLVDRLSHYVARNGGPARLEHVHRLDRGVSGLLVLSKTESLANSLRDQFAARKPQREYFAIVTGVLKKKKGTFDSLLATDRDLNRFSTTDESIGQRAITHYAVEREGSQATLVRVWLETGRRNQIRVHFAEAGHPVLGDPRYRPELARHRDWPYTRLALHARTLAFQHPATGRVLRFTSPLPVEFERFLQTLSDSQQPRSRDL